MASTAKLGKNKILMFRVDGTKAAAKLALQTEHTWNYNRSSDSTPTKDGAVASVGGLEVTLDISAVSSNDDVNNMLLGAVEDGSKLEVWEVDIAAPTIGGTAPNQTYTCPAIYATGYLGSWGVPSAAEGIEEFSTSMAIDYQPATGTAVLSAAQYSAAAAAYGFANAAAVV